MDLHDNGKVNFKLHRYCECVLQPCWDWLEQCGVAEASERCDSLLGHYQPPGRPPTALRQTVHDTETPRFSINVPVAIFLAPRSGWFKQWKLLRSAMLLPRAARIYEMVRVMRKSCYHAYSPCRTRKSEVSSLRSFRVSGSSKMVKSGSCLTAQISKLHSPNNTRKEVCLSLSC